MQARYRPPLSPVSTLHRASRRHFLPRSVRLLALSTVVVTPAPATSPTASFAAGPSHPLLCLLHGLKAAMGRLAFVGRPSKGLGLGFSDQKRKMILSISCKCFQKSQIAPQCSKSSETKICYVPHD
jgi:hypothetical protein